MKLKITVSRLQFVDGSNAFKPKWYYGFAHGYLGRDELVYYIIPLNHVVRFWIRVEKWYRRYIKYA